MTHISHSAPEDTGFHIPPARLPQNRGTMVVTPQIAQSLLDILAQYPEANCKRLSQKAESNHVERLANIMRTGGWDNSSHQGFLLGKNGVLLDGRHRCMAVVESGATIIVQATFDESKTMAQQVKADVNAALRSLSYVTGLDKKISYAAAFLVRFVTSQPLPSDTDVAAVGETLIPAYEKLFDNGVSRNRTWASGYHLSAFLLRLLDASNKSNDAEITELGNIYHALSNNDPAKLVGLPYSYWKQATTRKMSQTEKFVRLWRALDPTDRTALDKLQFKNLSATTGLLRMECTKLIPRFKALEAVK